MARRRLIDPAMWQSGHFKRLNLRQRLLWTGVITLAVVGYALNRLFLLVENRVLAWHYGYTQQQRN